MTGTSPVVHGENFLGHRYMMQTGRDKNRRVGMDRRDPLWWRDIKKRKRDSESGGLNLHKRKLTDWEMKNRQRTNFYLILGLRAFSRLGPATTLFAYLGRR